MAGGDKEASWADQVEEQDVPPGFEKNAEKEDVAADLAKAVEEKAVVQTPEDDVDEPDPSLKTPGLREQAAEVQVEGGEDIYRAAEKFEDLGLSEELLKGLYQEMKFERPSKIQAKTLPMILNPPYKSMIAQAHNGSGKTTCFALSMLSRVDPAQKHPQAICVVNVRELAVQTANVIAKMAKYTTITIACTAEQGQGGGARSTRRSKIVDQIVVGTHGTLKNWMMRDRILQYNNIQILVFDEADTMLAKDGQADDSLRMLGSIRQKCPKVQVLLFSATFEDRIKEFAFKVAPGANHVFVERDRLSLDVIKQFKVQCANEEAKIDFLKSAFGLSEKLCQTVVFVRTKSSADKLAASLKADGFSVTNLHGSLDKDVRDRVVVEFREGKTKIMIATDVLSRGFDLETISLVINFNVPTDKTNSKVMFETYLHRIGRSGRFGRKGCAFNLYEHEREKQWLGDIERHFQHTIEEAKYDDEDQLEAILKEAGL